MGSYVMGQIQNLLFCDGRNSGDIFSCPEISVPRLDTMNGFSEWTAVFITWPRGHVAIATQFVTAMDGIDCSIFSVRHILKIVFL